MRAIDNARRVQLEAQRSLVFISYRFGDSSYAAGRLARDLIAAFGRERVFFDHESITVGEPFPDSIRNALARARVLLVLIGPNWLKARDSAFRRLIDDPADYVYQEVSSGLDAREGVTVLPVLLQNASTFEQDDLPAAIAKLASLKPLHLDAPKWDEGVKAIAALIETQGIPAVTPSSPHATRGQSEPPSTSDVRELGPPAREPGRALWLSLACLLSVASYLVVDHWVKEERRTLIERQQEDLRHQVQGLRSAVEHIIELGPRGERGESDARRAADQASQLSAEVHQLWKHPDDGERERRGPPRLAAEVLWRAQMLEDRIEVLLRDLGREHEYWTTSQATSLAASPRAVEHDSSSPPLTVAGDARVEHEGSDAVRASERLAGEALRKMDASTAWLERARALVAAAVAERPNPLSRPPTAPGARSLIQRLVPLADELAALADLAAQELDAREREEAVKFLIRTAKFDARAMTERSPPPLPSEKWDGYFFLYSSETSVALCLAHGADPTRENQLFGNLRHEERDIIRRLKDAAFNESEATQAHLTTYEFTQPSTGRKGFKVAYAIALQSPPRASGGETRPYRNWWIGTGHYPEPPSAWPWAAWLPMPLTGLACVLAVDRRAQRRRTTARGRLAAGANVSG